ncbi:S1 RNA-binding domain-containing protein [Lusitaniella coriacea LEGE 07157]|uniref:S1 RNA-binding domain-containing protein n=1 Tax=Lusitaniella coriacea LEGE 07157 TaxID=945747 RepID=A0A8J7DLQ1_9CYAN|nr:S1 RNA-binding domain-containing protein [Lusitaniella coriacea]MBE9115493.1 S1 RNA-binding domain-containing protein [Lusitaniella coriacea LEGE 07157]
MTSESTRSQSANTPFSMEDFAKALEKHDYEFTKGQVVRGTVFEYTSDGVYVDIGGKSAGFVPLKEIALRHLEDSELAEILPLQTEQEFLIIREQDADGQILLSYRQLLLKAAWEEMAEVQANGESVQMYVTGSNKGGVMGEVKGLRAFIPRSHLVEKENLDALQGQSLTTTCLEVDEQRNKLVLSQRNAMRATAMQALQTNSVVEGKVVSIKPYGVFVDLGSVTGLLHIKQISSSRIGSLEDWFSLGQSIKVAIAEIDEFKNRISLSTKAFESHPGELLEKWDEVMANAEERFEAAQEERRKEKEATPQPPASGEEE